MDKDRFDLMFDQAFEEAAKQHTIIPDPSDSWKEIGRKLNRRKKRKQILKFIPYTAASFLLGAVIFGTPAVSNAISPVFQTMKQIQEDVVTFIFGSDEYNTENSKTVPPDDGSENARTESLQPIGTQNTLFETWEEAADHISFYPVSVHHVPDEYELMEVRLYYRDEMDAASEAVLLYELNQSTFRVIMRQLESSESISSASDLTSSSYETLQIHGMDAILTKSSDGRVRLEYLYSNIYFTITGSLSKEQAIQIAASIQ